MSALDDVHKIIDDCEKNLAEAADIVANSARTIRLYVIRIGLETIQSKRRRENRREIKRELRPQYKRGPVTGSIEFTKGTRERLAKIVDRVYGPEGWMIGNLNIGDFTKPMLMAQALAEEKSAKGSMVNARLYRSFASPLPDDAMTVKQYWNAKEFLKEKRRVQSETDQLEVSLG